MCCCTAEAVSEQRREVHSVNLFKPCPGTSVYQDTIPPAKVGDVVASEKSGLCDQRVAPPFMARIRKDTFQERWGWRVDLMNSHAVHICKIEEDLQHPVAAHNASVAETVRLRPGDFIMAVNGESSSSAAMSQILQNADAIDLVVQRPSRYVAVVEGHAGTIGVEVVYSQGAAGTESMVVGSVDAKGPMMRCAPEVKVGDRFLTVNGVPACHAAMIEALRTHKPIELTLARPPPRLTEDELSELLEANFPRHEAVWEELCLAGACTTETE